MVQAWANCASIDSRRVLVLAILGSACGVAAAQELEREDRSVIYLPGDQAQQEKLRPTRPVPTHPGPHLLMDDALIESSENLQRVVRQPIRDPNIGNPIVRGEEDRCFQPYFTVSRNPETGRFRMWYGTWREDRARTRSHLAYLESSDGVHWDRPTQILKDPGTLEFGSEVIDRGPDYPDPSKRYIYSYYHEGLSLAVSADGITFQPLVDRAVLEHDHDINNLSWDPLRNQFVAIVSTITNHPDFRERRRTTMQSVSTDLLNWERPWYVLRADDAFDEGDTQFYGLQGFLTRGPLRIGMVKVLRDDLHATETEENSYGMGWTTLAWSRDGRSWVRDQTIFFGPDPSPKAWDHAHTWIDEQLVVGNQVYLYYGGYKQGHKMNRFSERQIGLVTMPLDRYVARTSASDAEATLTTVPFHVNHPLAQLCVNVDAAEGTLYTEVVHADTGKVYPGLGFDDCRPLRVDGLRAQVNWGPATAETLRALEGNRIRIRFRLTNAKLYSFDFLSAGPKP